MTGCTICLSFFFLPLSLFFFHLPTHPQPFPSTWNLEKAESLSSYQVWFIALVTQ